MSGGLLLSALLIGLIGIPHCVTMCAAPCHGVARRCASTPAGLNQATLALHGGRVVGYAVAGALVAGSLSIASSWSAHIQALRPLWVMLQAGMLVFGAWLLVIGRLPAGLVLNVPTVPSIAVGAGGSSPGNDAAPRFRGLWAAFVAGLAWVALPCTQLYAGLMVAAMASGPYEGAVAAMVFAAPGTVAMSVGPRVMRKTLALVASLLAPRAGSRTMPIAIEQSGHLQTFGDASMDADQLRRLDVLTVRLAGIALMGSASWMLAHSAGAGWAYLCGV